MATKTPPPPRWIIVRLSDDLNWWLDEASDEIYWAVGGRSILDPHQVNHLIEVLDQYRLYGFRREQLASAFQVFAMQSELSDGRLRLAPTNESLFDTGGQLFALPLIAEEGTGAFYDLLDAIGDARVRLLNATHHYVRDCTDLDMYEELDALDQDRFFSAESIHAFDEITEILEWSPAEWEDSGQ